MKFRVGDTLSYKTDHEQYRNHPDGIRGTIVDMRNDTHYVFDIKGASGYFSSKAEWIDHSCFKLTGAAQRKNDYDKLFV